MGAQLVATDRGAVRGAFAWIFLMGADLVATVRRTILGTLLGILQVR